MGSVSVTTFAARWQVAVLATLLALSTLALLVITLDDYGMAWDEGFTVEREERLQEWFGRVVGGVSGENRAWSPYLSKLDRRSAYLRDAGPAADSPWSRESLRFYWQFAREEPNGHPPFYALLGLAGWAVSHHVLPPLESYRLGPAVLFSMTIGVLYLVMAGHYGTMPALMAVIGLLTMPRVFAHAHLASYDVPTLCLWFLATAAFLRAAAPPEECPGRRWPWTIAFGVAWGCAAGTKLTGWFIPVPLVVWALLYRDWRAARALVLGGVVAAVVLYAMVPTWWAAPVEGLRAFFVSNLGRQQLKPIPTIFFGHLYLFSLPWYNTLVLTAILVPPLTLVLALLGVGRALAGRLRDRVATLYLLCWGFFMVLRALPNAPGHDGARQFLASFAFLACLAGIGLQGLQSGLARLATPRLARAGALATLAVASLGGAWSTWRHHPLQLSYYNVFIGGLAGAARAGLEPTYYWEAVTPDVRDWLNRNTTPGRTVAFVFPAVTFEYLQRWGLLNFSHLTTLAEGPQWFVVMNRPGHLRHPKPDTLGQFLLDHGRPAFVKSLDAAPDVPLIAIYSGEEAFAADLILKRRRPPPANTSEERVPPTIETLPVDGDDRATSGP